MNPWAFLVIAVGILLIIIGVQGTQHGIGHAITGHGSASTASTGTTNPGTQTSPNAAQPGVGYQIT